MKFQVRAGFVIHDTRIVKINDKNVEQVNSYYENDTVDFDEKTAEAHLHKLEPLDKAAIAYAQARHAQVSAPPAPGLDSAQLASVIATAVANALAAQAQTALATKPAAP